MPIRLFYYMAEIWRKYLKEHHKETIKRSNIKLQNTISAIFLLDQKIDSNEFLNRAGIIGNEFNLISNAHKLKLTDWLDHIMNDPTRQTAIDLIKNPEKDVNKMTANITITLMEEKERAIAEGKAKGKIEGKAEAKVEIAKKLLANNMTIEQVMELTELDLETLKGLLP